jgi:hypothetical protein
MSEHKARVKAMAMKKAAATFVATAFSFEQIC